MAQEVFPHQDDYATKEHDHASLNYASAGHDHDSTYEGSHNHDGDYATGTHDHDIGSDTGWIEITSFSNGATAYQTGVNNTWTPRYRKIDGIVYLQGLINTNTTSLILATTLPVGFRPKGRNITKTMTQGSSECLFYLYDTGSVYFVATTTTGWHSITANFPADN